MLNRDEFHKDLERNGFDIDNLDWNEVKLWLLYNIYFAKNNVTVSLANEYFEHFG